MSIILGNESEFLSADGAFYNSVATLDLTKFVVAYQDDDDDDHGTVRVGVISGADVTFGAEAECLSDPASYLSIIALSATKFVVAYRDGGDSNHGTVKVGTISGTDVTFGAEAEFLSVGDARYISIAALGTTKFIVVYQDNADSQHGTAKIGTVSGTTITFGAETEFLSVGASVYNDITILSDTKFIVAYRDNADAGHGTAKVGTVSGTTITFGAETEFVSTGSAGFISTAPLSATKFVVACQDASDSDHGTAKIGTVSGTTITFGAETEFLSAGMAIYISIATFNATKFVVAYADIPDSFHGTLKVGTVSGTTITFGAETEFLSDGGAADISIATFSAGQFVVAYRDQADSNHGTIKTGMIPPYPLDVSINLYIKGCQPQQSGIDLFINGPVVHTSGIDLFEHGHQPKISNITLYIGPSEVDDDGVVLLIHGYQPQQSGIDLITFGHEPNASGIDLFMATKDTTSQNITLHIGGDERVYYQTFEEFQVGQSGVWHAVDLQEYGIPFGSVLEIDMENIDQVNPQWAGVRETNSSQDRRAQIHRSQGVGYKHVDQMQMHVNMDASGWIECYAEDASQINFYILGYWISGVYVEKAEVLTSPSNNATWDQIDLGSYGIGDGQVADILMSNIHTSMEVEHGVRQIGSTIDRKFDLHEAEGGGEDCCTMAVKASGASGTIGYYAEQTVYSKFQLIGYWSTPPLPEYTEIFFDTVEDHTTAGDVDEDSPWTDRNLIDIFCNRPAGSVAEFIMHSENVGWGIPIGLRGDGDTMVRALTLNEAEGDGTDTIRMHVSIRRSRIVETVEGGGSLSSCGWALVGYWSYPALPINKLNCHITGQSGLLTGLKTKKIYWTELTYDGIQRCNPDGSEFEIIISSGLANPYGIAIDRTSASPQVYYYDEGSGTIFQCNLDGSNITPFLKDTYATEDLRVLVIHPGSGKIYWTSETRNSIQSANLIIPSGETFDTRTDIENVITGLNKPWGLDIDLVNNYLYWSSSADDNIERVKLDGTDRKEIIPEQINHLYTVAVDPYRGRIYWGDNTIDELYAANIDQNDGLGQITVTTTGTGRFYGLAVDFDANKIYWADQAYDKVYRTDPLGIEVEVVIAGDWPDIPITSPFGLALYQIYESNNNLDLFVKAPEGTSDNLDLFLRVAWEISASGTLHQFGPMPVTSGLDLYLENFQTTASGLNLFLKTIEPYTSGLPLYLKVPEPQTGGLSLYTTGFGPPTDLEIYITASMSGTPHSGVIDRITLDPSGTNHQYERLIVSSGFYDPREIVINQSDGKMYWCEYGGESGLIGRGAIWRANLTGEFQEKIVWGSGTIYSPVGLALDEVNQKIYWGDYHHHTIKSANLDGTSIQVVASGSGFAPSGCHEPKGVEISQIDNKIYYISSGTLVRGDLPDNAIGSREVLQSFHATTEYFALDIHDDHVYWNARFGKVRRSNLDGTEPTTIKLGLGTPRGVAINHRNDKLYWVDSETGKVQRSNFDKTEFETIYTFNPTVPMGLALDFPALGTVVLTDSLDLHLLGPSGASSGIGLYLENWGTSESFTAFMEVPGGPGTKSLDLYMVGSLSGESLFYSYLELYTAGKEIYNYYVNHTLYMEVPSGWASASGDWPLFLCGDDQTGINALDLMTYGHASGEAPRGILNFNSLNLMVANTGAHTGWYPTYDSKPLFLRALSGIWDDLSLYTSGVPKIGIPYSGNCTLAMSGHFVPVQTAPLYIFGISGSINSGPSGLFLHTYLDHIDQSGNLQLYTHGY